MKFFLIVLLIVQVFNCLQGSTITHKRSVEALDTNLQSNINGKDGETISEIEKSSCTTSQELNHQCNGEDCSSYTQKCSKLINNFLQAISNLLSSKNGQDGFCCFNVNTTVLRKAGECGQNSSDKPVPVIIIGARDSENYRPCVSETTQSQSLSLVPLTSPNYKDDTGNEFNDKKSESNYRPKLDFQPQDLSFSAAPPPPPSLLPSSPPETTDIITEDLKDNQPEFNFQSESPFTLSPETSSPSISDPIKEDDRYFEDEKPIFADTNLSQNPSTVTTDPTDIIDRTSFYEPQNSASTNEAPEPQSPKLFRDLPLYSLPSSSGITQDSFSEPNIENTYQPDLNAPLGSTAFTPSSTEPSEYLPGSTDIPLNEGENFMEQNFMPQANAIRPTPSTVKTTTEEEIFQYNSQSTAEPEIDSQTQPPFSTNFAPPQELPTYSPPTISNEEKQDPEKYEEQDTTQPDNVASSELIDSITSTPVPDSFSSSLPNDSETYESSFNAPENRDTLPPTTNVQPETFGPTLFTPHPKLLTSVPPTLPDRSEADVYEEDSKLGSYDAPFSPEPSTLTSKDDLSNQDYFGFNTDSSYSPAEPFEPSRPMDPFEPSRPMDPFEPSRPMDPFELSRPMDPFEPSTPMAPFEPSTPMAPFDPFEPSTRMGPFDPIEPSTTMAPFDPYEPSAPMASFNPIEPSTPMPPLEPFEAKSDPVFTPTDTLQDKSEGLKNEEIFETQPESSLQTSFPTSPEVPDYSAQSTTDEVKDILNDTDKEISSLPEITPSPTVTPPPEILTYSLPASSSMIKEKINEFELTDNKQPSPDPLFQSFSPQPLDNTPDEPLYYKPDSTPVLDDVINDAVDLNTQEPSYDQQSETFTPSPDYYFSSLPEGEFDNNQPNDKPQADPIDQTPFTPISELPSLSTPNNVDRNELSQPEKDNTEFEPLSSTPFTEPPEEYSTPSAASLTTNPYSHFEDLGDQIDPNLPLNLNQTIPVATPPEQPQYSSPDITGKTESESENSENKATPQSEFDPTFELSTPFTSSPSESPQATSDISNTDLNEFEPFSSTQSIPPQEIQSTFGEVPDPVTEQPITSEAPLLPTVTDVVQDKTNNFDDLQYGQSEKPQDEPIQSEEITPQFDFNSQPEPFLPTTFTPPSELPPYSLPVTTGIGKDEFGNFDQPKENTFSGPTSPSTIPPVPDSPTYSPITEPEVTRGENDQRNEKPEAQSTSLPTTGSPTEMPSPTTTTTIITNETIIYEEKTTKQPQLTLSWKPIYLTTETKSLPGSSDPLSSTAATPSTPSVPTSTEPNRNDLNEYDEKSSSQPNLISQPVPAPTSFSPQPTFNPSTPMDLPTYSPPGITDENLKDFNEYNDYTAQSQPMDTTFTPLPDPSSLPPTPENKFSPAQNENTFQPDYDLTPETLRPIPFTPEPEPPFNAPQTTTNINMNKPVDYADHIINQPDYGSMSDPSSLTTTAPSSYSPSVDPKINEENFNEFQKETMNPPDYDSQPFSTFAPTSNLPPYSSDVTGFPEPEQGRTFQPDFNPTPDFVTPIPELPYSSPSNDEIPPTEKNVVNQPDLNTQFEPFRSTPPSEQVPDMNEGLNEFQRETQPPFNPSSQPFIPSTFSPRPDVPVYSVPDTTDEIRDNFNRNGPYSETEVSPPSQFSTPSQPSSFSMTKEEPNLPERENSYQSPPTPFGPTTLPPPPYVPDYSLPPERGMTGDQYGDYYTTDADYNTSPELLQPTPPVVPTNPPPYPTSDSMRTTQEEPKANSEPYFNSPSEYYNPTTLRTELPLPTMPNNFERESTSQTDLSSQPELSSMPPTTIPPEVPALTKDEFIDPQTETNFQPNFNPQPEPSLSKPLEEPLVLPTYFEPQITSTTKELESELKPSTIQPDVPVYPSPSVTDVKKESIIPQNEGPVNPFPNQVTKDELQVNQNQNVNQPAQNPQSELPYPMPVPPSAELSGYPLPESSSMIRNDYSDPTDLTYGNMPPIPNENLLPNQQEFLAPEIGTLPEEPIVLESEPIILHSETIRHHHRPPPPHHHGHPPPPRPRLPHLRHEILPPIINDAPSNRDFFEPNGRDELVGMDLDYRNPQERQPSAGVGLIQDDAGRLQPDSYDLVPLQTAQANQPGENLTSHQVDYENKNVPGALMCPFDPAFKGNMTAPSYYILVSKLPSDSSSQSPGDSGLYQVEKVYLGDGTPLNCSINRATPFPTSNLKPIPFFNPRTVKLSPKLDNF